MVSGGVDAAFAPPDDDALKDALLLWLLLYTVPVHLTSCSNDLDLFCFLFLTGSRLQLLYSILLVLVLFVGGIDAVFTPANSDALKTAVGTCTFQGVCSGGCLGETADGSCPIFAANNGNGLIGDWDISKVTSLEKSM